MKKTILETSTCFALLTAFAVMTSPLGHRAGLAHAATLSSDAPTSPTDFVDAETWETYSASSCEQAAGRAYWVAATIASRCVYKTCEAIQHLLDCWNSTYEVFVCSKDEMDQIQDEFAEAKLACSLGTFYSGDDDGSGSECLDSRCLTDTTVTTSTYTLR